MADPWLDATITSHPVFPRDPRGEATAADRGR